MSGTILVAVNSDDSSLEVARVAGQMARVLSADLKILTVRRAASNAFGEPYYSASISAGIAEAERVLDHCRRVATEQGASNVSVEHVEGSPVERIVEFAHREGCVMIVVGTRGRGRIRSALLGSVSGGVAAHSLVPVLVVPDSIAVHERDVARTPLASYAAS